ncbi:phage/plasmid primase, P4 family [Nocardia sp. NPDC050412]|uniref:DNA primase family protein n=1 Tax=Nocardia sp. NPDC050412 TaxID=3364320 RepID=UPI0037A46B05
MSNDENTWGAADSAAPSGASLEREFPPPSAPLPVARQIYEGHQLEDGTPTLVAWRGGWMQWGGTHWVELDPAALRSAIYRVLENAIYDDEEKGWTDWNPNRHKVANIMEALAAVGHLPTRIDPPAYLDGTPVRKGIIACRNGLLHIDHRTLTEHTPTFFNIVSVPFDYQHDALEPVAWLEFLASVWPDDPDSIALLQEYTGYVLSGRTDMQKALLLIGPTRSGKGTYARLLTELVGRGNAAGPTLASLGTNFGLSPLLGKPLAVVSDARLGDGNVRTVVERLLSITGEDMLTIDRKFKEPWNGKLPSRFVILSNELPRFGDASGAIANRFLVLQMTNSFLGKEDRTLDARLTAELPGILSWALDGLDRLVRNGRFTVPTASQDATTLMMDLASPISAFVRDCCVRTPTAYIDRATLYQAWKSWCDDNGHRAGSNSTFGRDLRAVVPELLASQSRVGDGKRVHRYDRIGLRAEVIEAMNSALNADPPVPPVPVRETTGQRGCIDDELPVPGDDDPVPPIPGGTGNGVAGTGSLDVEPQVKQGGTGGTGESAFKDVLTDDIPPVVRTPGRSVGQWLGSGEPVNSRPVEPGREEKVRGYLLARLGKANGDPVPRSAMQQCVSGKTGDRALVPAVLADLIAEGALIEQQIPGKRKGAIGYRLRAHAEAS